jgi:LPS-assembly lipoprotein
MSRFAVLIFGATLFLTACGFEPLYGGRDTGRAGAEDILAQIDIANIPDREGQYLRNALIDRFYRHGRPSDPLYTLQISPVRETLTDLDITKSSDATRGQLRLSAHMALIERASGQTVLTRDLTSITSYNILGSEFSTRVSEENTRLNALNDLARQIELQTSLYLRR